MATRRERVYFELSATDAASRVFRQVETSAQGLRSAYGQLTGALAVLGSAGFVGVAIKKAQEAEQAQARLGAVIRATGGAAGIARAEYDKLADSLSEVSQFDDESVRAAQAQLIKFGNIHGQVFRDALKLSADMAAFMGTELPDAAQLLGKALQSPTEGITTLERQFGKLSEAQEKNIKELVEQGRAWEAQQAVLEIVRQKVGGVAEEMNTGLTRATRDLSKASNELLETLGKEGKALNQTMEGLSSLMKDLKGELEGARTPLRDLLYDTLDWLGALRFVPGAIGMIGQAARGARQQATRRDLTGSGRIDYTADVRALEAGLGAYAGPLVLGGGGDRGAAEKAARERAQISGQVAASLQAQQEILDEANALGVKFLQEQEKKREEAAKKAIEDQKRVTAAWVETAQIATEAWESMVYTADAAGNSIEITREQFEAMEEDVKRLAGAGQQLGFVFQSAFEDAVIEGRKLSEVIKALGQDIARIFLRKTVTEPLGNMFAAWAGSLFTGGFGGARAEGGPVAGGRAYLVGEAGPELFVPGRSGAIVPSGGAAAAGVEPVIVNLTMNVRALDSKEVTQVLIEQRETIKKVVRQAWNERGRATPYG